MRHNRLAKIVLAVVLLFVSVSQTLIPVRADFENTYQNTGDQRADLIGVALTQVGYREGPNNYTKYGVWYGAPNTAWCGMFVSWCANQAGIPTSVIRKNGFASASGFGLSAFYISDRIPRAGDLFFKTNGSHTGIVYYVDGEYFYTLEGNTDESSYDGVGVFIRKRSLYGSYYFASPNYQSDSGHNYVRGSESTHPHKEFYKCSDCGSMYYTGTYGRQDSCKQCLQETCTHSYGAWQQSDAYSHIGVCSICEKQTQFDHDWANDRILTEATCQSAGSKWQKCRKCAATRVADIPVSTDHPYSQWEYVDQATHLRTCTACGKEDVATHTGEQWYTDAAEHWHNCEDCGGRASIAQHDHQGSCDNPCVECGYTIQNSHVFAAVLSYDDTGHFYACSGCAEKKDAAEHVFDAPCDETCGQCGYVRQTEHTYTEQWQSNENGHWYSCQICGQTQELLPHVLNARSADKAGQTCSVCGYQYQQVHVHTFTAYSQSADTHGNVCDCGETAQGGGHIWDLATGSCSVCAAALPELAGQAPDWIYLLPAVALVAAAVACILASVRGGKKKHMNP